MPSDKKIFVVMPEERVFTAAEFDSLRIYLDHLNSVTTLTPIVDFADLRIRDDGLLEDGYKLSYLAFNQLCQCAAAGLSVLASDISGLKPRNHIVEEVTSIPTTIRIINSCVRLRFRAQKGLMGRQCVRNVETKVIDGIVGPAYRYLPHIELFDAVTSMVEDAEQPAKFHEARLNGRWLSFAMRSVDSIFTLPTGQRFFSGYYFNNSEAGECSVSAGTTLSSDAFAGYCAHSVRGGDKLAHAGKSFYHRVAGLLATAMMDAETVTQLSARAAQLQSIPLRLLTDEGRYRKQRVMDIAYTLTEKSRIPREVAHDILRQSVWTGAYRDKPLPRLSRSEVSKRTVFDIFATMMRVSGQYHYHIREKIEKAAYDLLLEKFKLTEESNEKETFN